jgi:hypothetical protein
MRARDRWGQLKAPEPRRCPRRRVACGASGRLHRGDGIGAARTPEELPDRDRNRNRNASDPITNMAARYGSQIKAPNAYPG